MASASFNTVFETLGTSFEKQDALRELIRERRDAADTAVRNVQRALASLFIESDLAPATAAVRPLLAATGKPIIAIESALPDEPGAFHRYVDMWTQQLQTLTSVAVIVHFLESDKLADVTTVQKMLGAEIGLPLENYLVGVCNTLSELVRLSMIRVTKGDFNTPYRCTDFATKVFEAFKELNLRNDFLRRRYDGIKYDVKRLEEIIYDLSIRGLQPPQNKDNPQNSEMKATEPSGAEMVVQPTTVVNGADSTSTLKPDDVTMHINE